MSDAPKFDPDTLFLALRRPAMMWGVPSIGCVMNIGGSVIAGGWIGLGTWHILIWAVMFMTVIHLIMRVMVAKDYHRFHILTIYLQTKAQSGFENEWGGSSLSPLTVKWPTKARDYPFDV